MRYPAKFFPHHPDTAKQTFNLYLVVTGLLIVVLTIILLLNLVESKKDFEINMYETAIKNNSKP